MWCDSCQVHLFVRGTVTDAHTGKAIANATVIVEDSRHQIHTSSTGQYWRPLAPGSYHIIASAPGWDTGDFWIIYKVLCLSHHISFPVVQIHYNVSVCPGSGHSSGAGGLQAKQGHVTAVPSRRTTEGVWETGGGAFGCWSVGRFCPQPFTGSNPAVSQLQRTGRVPPRAHVQLPTYHTSVQVLYMSLILTILYHD